MSVPPPPVRLSPAYLRLLLNGAPFQRCHWEAASDPHLHLRIANAQPLTKRTESLDALEAFRRRIRGVGFGYCDHWQRREAIYLETDISFLDRFGEPALIPCAIIARVVKGVVNDLRFHLDPSPIP